MTRILPTVGRIVWYFPEQGEGSRWGTQEPCAAIIAKVLDEQTVNLAVFKPDGFTIPKTSIRLVQPDVKAVTTPRCEWMPYQVGQAAKTEQLEKQLEKRRGVEK